LKKLVEGLENRIKNGVEVVKMGCDYPVRCKYWDGKKCIANFEELAKKGINPCEQHQLAIDVKAEKDFIKAWRAGDEDLMEAIISSPFTNFGK